MKKQSLKERRKPDCTRLANRWVKLVWTLGSRFWKVTETVGCSLPNSDVRKMFNHLTCISVGVYWCLNGWGREALVHRGPMLCASGPHQLYFGNFQIYHKKLHLKVVNTSGKQTILGLWVVLFHFMNTWRTTASHKMYYVDMLYAKLLWFRLHNPNFGWDRRWDF